jgi:hypothetical protein
MSSFPLQFKLHLLFLAPVTAVFFLNCVVLHIAELPVLLALNVLIYVMVVSVSILFLGHFCDKLHRHLKQLAEAVDTVQYSANLLKSEVPPAETMVLADIYKEMKYLLFSCRHLAEKDKGYLTIAKDIGRICSEMGTAALESEDKETHDTNKIFFVSDCILNNSLRMTSDLKALGLTTTKKKKSKKKESPFKAGSLRRAIRLAEKRAA